MFTVAPGLLDAVNLTVDHVEDWSTGKCVNDEHGEPDCVLDRWQLCAQHRLGTADFWHFLACNYRGVDDVTNVSAVATLASACYDEAQITSPSFKTLAACAVSDESAAWAHASGDKTANDPTGGHPEWLEIDGQSVVDSCSPRCSDTQLAAWAKTVLIALCDRVAGAKPNGCN